MFTLKTENVVECLKGSAKNLKIKNQTIKKIATNHKEAENGSVFVALKGEKFDGHNFAQQAVNSGAEFAVVEQPQENISQIVVENTRQALLNIAALNRAQFKGPLVAVTGSVGKTTTKDLIALALSSSETVLKTEKNLNNEIGLAQTILNLEPQHTAAVVEMGMSHAGEISKMSIAAQPTIGVLTAIGKAHMQNFKNIKEILNAKLELLNGMNKNSPIVFNADDEMLKTCNFNGMQAISCSTTNPNAEVFASEIEQLPNEIKFLATIKKTKQSTKFKLPLIGLHNVSNALLSIAVASQLNLNLEQVAKKLENFETTGLRQKILTYNQNIKVFADCYNAGPESMKTALISVSKMKCAGRKIAVLGDMLELGTIAKKEHEKIGTLLNNLTFDEILCLGELAEIIAKTTKSPARHFKSAEQLAEFLKTELEPNDLILFKASYAMNLKSIVEKVFGKLNY